MEQPVSDRINQLLTSKSYRCAYHKTKQLEETRIFCKHDLSHFLDVARLALILNLKMNLGVSEELIYAAALLHDIGRFKQYENKIPHEQASVPIADEILSDCGFGMEEKEDILRAILLHRDEAQAMQYPLARLIYEADKMSRACYFCESRDACHKTDEQRNLYLKG